MAQSKNPFLDTATTLGKLVGFLAISVLCGVLVAGLVVPTVALVGTAASSSISAFDQLPDQLKVDNPPEVTTILASDGSTIASLYDQNRTPVPLDQMSQFIKDGIVSIEDARYYEHGGVDPKGILRSIVAAAGGSRQGASTITQQYVNNVLNYSLEAQGKGDQASWGINKTLGDKIREIKLAISLEKKYSKDDILKGYLNIVNFSNGAFGIQAASQLYFQVNAKDLTLPQAALLAGVVNSPGAYDPVAHPEAAKSRRDMVLNNMLDQKKISQAQHDAAVATPIQVHVVPRANGCIAAPTAQFFCDYVKNLFLSNPDYGATPEARASLLTQGGLTIKTTLDPKAQQVAQDQANATSSPDDIQRLNRGAAIVSVQPGTGKVVAMAQNFKMSNQTAHGQTAYNFSVPRFDANGNYLGGLGTMQAGSTMKPFTFASWLDAGKSLNAVVDGSRQDYGSNFKWTNSCGTTSSTYKAGESGPLQNDEPNFYKPMSVVQGLAGSINTITFATAAQLDFCNIKKMTQAVGLSKLNTDHTAQEPLDFAQASELLGNDSIAPLTLANAFATFASGGIHCEPNALVSVTDQQGKNLPVPSGNCKQTVQPGVAAGVLFGMTRVLNDPIGSGSIIKPAVRQTYNIGVKTGTSNFNQDTWVVGTTTGLTTASWFGNPTGNTNDIFYNNQNVSFNGIPYPQLDGKDVAGTAFSQYMNTIASSYSPGAFPAVPANLTTQPVQPKPSGTSSAPASGGASAPPASNPPGGDSKGNGNGNQGNKP
ncbi:transglycosylase domain-containing protein [Psychromicrobium xiongbiense]|uniref:transglycosylase domain-containing protein n=1 Tax=Psychromicrobium xiongbiense TaxID=3051184 RepID=UPI0025552891|nr:transglycosylase domain-containing protein [Psychromicrobium sp. YIM S02556]